MKSLLNILEKFFDNIGAVNHVIKLERLGITKFGEYRGKDCYYKRIKGGRIRIRGTNSEYEFDLDINAPYLNVYIMPAGKEYKNYMLMIAYSQPQESQLFYIYMNRSTTYGPKNMAYVSGRRVISSIMDKNNILDEWGFFHYALSRSVTILEFNQISFPPHVETLIREVLKIDMND